MTVTSVTVRCERPSFVDPASTENGGKRGGGGGGGVAGRTVGVGGGGGGGGGCCLIYRRIWCRSEQQGRHNKRIKRDNNQPCKSALERNTLTTSGYVIKYDFLHSTRV